MLHKHSLIVMWCHQWKLTVLYTGGLKKKKMMLSLAITITVLLWCSLFTGKKKRLKRVEYDSSFEWKKLHVLQDTHGLASTDLKSK